MVGTSFLNFNCLAQIINSSRQTMNPHHHLLTSNAVDPVYNDLSVFALGRHLVRAEASILIGSSFWRISELLSVGGDVGDLSRAEA